MTETEWRFGYERSRATRAGIHPSIAELYRRVGMSGDELDEGRHCRGGHYLARVVPVPERHHRLVDGMAIEIGGRSWRIVVGRGHAPEHACLYCSDLDVLIAGDQVLPKISPNVSFWPQDQDPDPLGSFSPRSTHSSEPSPRARWSCHRTTCPSMASTPASSSCASCTGPALPSSGLPAGCRGARPSWSRYSSPGLSTGISLASPSARPWPISIDATTIGRLHRGTRADGVWSFPQTI